MTVPELLTLERRLRQMRDEHTWSIGYGRGRDGHDEYRRRLDAVLRDVRALRQHGAFYNEPALAVQS